MTGKPIFDYPADRRAPDGEGCATCEIVLEADAIDGYCSPECCEWADRCKGCDRGQTWCTCVHTHCIDCGEPLSNRDQDLRYQTCRACADIRQQARFDAATSNQQRST